MSVIVPAAGVLLRMLQMEGNLEGISHVFVDEVRFTRVCIYVCCSLTRLSYVAVTLPGA